MKKKSTLAAVLTLGTLLAPAVLQTAPVVQANDFYKYQAAAQAADITNWIASTPEQITSNIQSQNINVNNLDGEIYIIQWGDTLWGISQATGISIAKLAYDNNIQNIDLIYAGDQLVLKRDGEVPADYRYQGDGYHCAMTKVVINNYIHNGDNYYYEDNSVNITNVVKINQTFMENNTQNNTTQYYPSADVAGATGGNFGKSQKENQGSPTVSENSSTSDSSSTSSSSTVDPSSDTSVSSSSSSSASSTTSSTSSSSTSISNTSSDTTSNTIPATSEKVLETEQFLDAIQDEVKDLFEKETPAKQLTFISHVAEKENPTLATSEKSGLEVKNLYATSKDELELPVDLNKYTEEVAKKIAKEIRSKLTSTELTELTEADKLQIVLGKSNKTVNIKLYTGKKESETTEETETNRSGTEGQNRATGTTTKSNQSTTTTGTAETEESDE